MSRHRSPQRRRAHHGPPLSALVAAAGAGGAHRSVSLPQVVSTPVRAVAALIAGGALAAAGQHALTTALPTISDGTNALRVSLDRAVGLTPTGSSSDPAVAPVPPEPAVADAASLIKAAELKKAAGAVRPGATAGSALAALANGAGAALANGSGSALAGGAAAVSPTGGIRILAGPVTSGFGGRWGAFHEGLDIAAPIGTPIHVPLGGTVISSGPASGFGLWVRVQHADGTITVYGHINRSFVHVGQQVATGDVIAETGNRGQSTGPHLHIGVMVNGVYVNPRPWLDARGIKY